LVLRGEQYQVGGYGLSAGDDASVCLREGRGRKKGGGLSSRGLSAEVECEFSLTMVRREAPPMLLGGATVLLYFASRRGLNSLEGTQFSSPARDCCVFFGARGGAWARTLCRMKDDAGVAQRCAQLENHSRKGVGETVPVERRVCVSVSVSVRVGTLTDTGKHCARHFPRESGRHVTLWASPSSSRASKP
jgi:hypothetical protein